MESDGADGSGHLLAVPEIDDRMAVLNGSADSLRDAYSNLQQINRYLRDQMFKVSSGTIVLMGAADGWFVTKQAILTPRLAPTIVCGFVILVVIAILSVRSHYRELLASATMIVRVERALGFYDRGRYIARDTLYDPSSQAWGSGEYERHVVFAHVGAIAIFSLFSCFLIAILGTS